MNEPSEVGTRLREWRESRGLTRPALSSLMEVAVGTLRNHEMGVSQPKTEHLQKLARLGCDVSWLLTGAASGHGSAVTSDFVSDGLALDADLIAAIETMLEQWLERHQRKMDPQRRGRFIAEAYAFCMDEYARAQEPVNGVATRVVERLLRLVA